MVGGSSQRNEKCIPHYAKDRRSILCAAITTFDRHVLNTTSELWTHFTRVAFEPQDPLDLLQFHLLHATSKINGDFPRCGEQMVECGYVTGSKNTLCYFFVSVLSIWVLIKWWSCPWNRVALEAKRFQALPNTHTLFLFQTLNLNKTFKNWNVSATFFITTSIRSFLISPGPW